MTAERRVVIEIGDIKGFEFECPKCGTRTYVPVQNYSGIRQSCQNCPENWFEAIGARDHQLIHEMLQNIRTVKAMIPGPRVKIKLEVEAAKE